MKRHETNEDPPDRESQPTRRLTSLRAISERLSGWKEIPFPTIASVRQKILPEAPVAVFLLPVGTKPDEFVSLFDFSVVVQELQRGRFHRPRLVVWAGRSDIDRKALAKSLRHDFTTQLEKERARLTSAAEQIALPQLDRLHAEREKAGQDVQTATFGLTSSLIFLFLVSAPIFNLIFMILAVFSGAGGVTKALHHVSLTLRMRSNQEALAKNRSELEAQLDQTDDRFVQAVDTLEVTVHPTLHRLTSLMCEVDQTLPPIPLEAPTSPPPEISDFLRRKEFLDALPDFYRPLLDAVQL